MTVLFSRLLAVSVLILLLALSLFDGTSLNFASKWIPFLGRFHPVLLHLPIGLFAAVVLLELFVLVRPVARIPEKIHILLTACFYTTALSAVFGVFLSWEGGYETDALNFHKWGGVVTTFLIFFLDLSLKTRRTGVEQLPTVYLGGLVATILVMTITGHMGGSITHGSGFLTEHLPFAKDEPEEMTPSGNAVFETHIQPLLKDYCLDCHNPEKVKGELRMDNYEMLLAGGLNGPVLVAGNSDESAMIHRLQLPIEEEEHMPPQGKPQPTEEVIELLSWWIDQGASATALLDEMEVPPEIALHFLEHEVLEFRSREEMDEMLHLFPEPEGIDVYFLAQKDPRIGVRANKGVDESVEVLLALKENLVELNLANSQITDRAVEAVGQMTNLTHLHLQNTAVTDSGLEHLANLYQLEYLNLYNTAITDNALQVLRRLKALKNVYLWQTEVSEEGVAGLHNSLYRAVEADRLQRQIEEIRRERDRLRVEIVSAFDIELQAPKEEAVSSTMSISDVMTEFHEGKTSIANQAKAGEAEVDDLQRMLKKYQALVELSPPQGPLESWKEKTTKLVEATQGLIAGEEGAIESYRLAVDCKACHSVHRED